MKNELIELSQEDKEGDEKNFWYKKFKYSGKKYIMETKKSYAQKNEYIIYYCHYIIPLLKAKKLIRKVINLKLQNAIREFIIIKQIINI